MTWFATPGEPVATSVLERLGTRDRELGPATSVGRSRERECGERALEQRGGVLEREHAHGVARRALGGDHRDFGGQVTRGEQMVRDRAGLAGVTPFDRLCRPQVEPRTDGRIELVRDRLGDECVREPETIGRRHRDHAELDGRDEVRRELAIANGVGDNRTEEVATDDGRRLERGARRDRQATDALVNDLAHARQRGQAKLAAMCGRDELLDEQGIAGGELEDPRGIGAIPDQLGDVIATEPAEHEALRVALDAGERGGSARAGIGIARRDRDEHALAHEQRQHVLEQLER